MNFSEIRGPVSQEQIEPLYDLFTQAFDTPPSESFQQRLNEKNDLSILLVHENAQLIGFKIGYRKSLGVFFSWLGAVDKNHRRRGIARSLLHHQHQLCAERRYKEIQTEADGSNRAMIILNLQEGFEVYGTHIGHKDKLTVQLRCFKEL